MRFTYQAGAQPLAGYTIQRGIHRGGFGEVYFAHSDGGKEVALKLLHQQDQDVEIRGVTQCLNLKHPNLVNLFDLKTDGQGDQWVVMEYVSGSSLEDVLASFPDGLPLGEVRDWLSGLVAGVAHLHDCGIVHRDLKPANVYRENGVVKVGDVGLSKRLDSDHRRQHTQSVGTVYYMAPEVARGQYGPEVDVYSLGIMLYELITGKLPFTGETTAEILMKHLTAQPDLTPIPKSLRPTIARALEKDPRKRTPTVRDLERDFLRGVGSPSEPLAIPESSFLPPVPQNMESPHRASRIPSNGTHFDRPTPNGDPIRMNTTLNGHQNSAVNHSPWLKWIIPIAVLIFLSGNSHRHFSGLAVLAAVGLAVYYSRKTNSVGVHTLPLGSGGAESTTRPSEYVQRATVANDVRRTFTKPASAPIVRPWNERWPELTSSLGTSALVASILSAGIYFSLHMFGFRQAGFMPSVEHAVLFAATSIVGAWLVLIGNAGTAGSKWTKRQRWLVRLASGALLGTFAYATDEFLMVTTPPMSFTAKSAFSSLGVHRLAGPGVDPTWLGYACFFAGCFGIRRWSRETDPQRKERFRFWTLAGAVATAYFISLVFKFPQWYAVLWAGTISSTVQLASSWTPPRPAREWR